MQNQVVELIVYKVKKEFVDSFQSDTMPRFRKLISSFGGVISYQTFNSLDRGGVYFDQVVWENSSQAFQAIGKFEQLKEDGKHEELMNWFEEVTFMDHFKLVA